MNCPICQTTDLRIADRQGIEIDYCPQCRGVWLDRGELDKIIERSASLQPYRGVEERPPGMGSVTTTITTASITAEGESAAPSWMTCLTSAEAGFQEAGKGESKTDAPKWPPAPLARCVFPGPGPAD